VTPVDCNPSYEDPRDDKNDRFDGYRLEVDEERVMKYLLDRPYSRAQKKLLGVRILDEVETTPYAETVWHRLGGTIDDFPGGYDVFLQKLLADLNTKACAEIYDILGEARWNEIVDEIAQADMESDRDEYHKRGKGGY